MTEPLTADQVRAIVREELEAFSAGWRITQTFTIPSEEEHRQLQEFCQGLRRTYGVGTRGPDLEAPSGAPK